MRKAHHPLEFIAVVGTCVLFYVFLSIHCGGAARAQTRPRTNVWVTPPPDPLNLQSVNAVQVDAGTLNTEEVRATLVRAATVDAGVVYSHALRNVDAGAVYAPGGVTIDTGKFVTFTGPGGSGRIGHSGTNLLIDGSPGAVVTTDGLVSQGTTTAGSLQTVSGRVSGGASAATFSVVPGTGSPTNADLNLSAIGSGHVVVTGAEGLTTSQVGNADGGVLDVTGQAVFSNASWLKPTSWDGIPECTPALKGLKVLAEGTIDAEGAVVEEQRCDGTNWIYAKEDITLRAPPKAGDVPFYSLFPNRPGAVRYVATFVQDLGSGVGAFEIIIRTGNNVLCRGGGLCTDPVGTTSGIFCSAHDFPRNPDAGTAFALVGEIDAGCASNPGLNLTVGLTKYGYPKDGGWYP